MKKTNKIVVGSFIFVVVTFMIVISIFVHSLFVKQNINYLELNNEISQLQKELNKTSNNLESIGGTLNSFDKELVNLKDDSDFSSIIQNSMKSIVTIRANSMGEISSEGSGFFIADEGYVITNRHILLGMDTSSIEIETYDGKVYTFFSKNLSKLGDDGPMDITILKIDSNNYSPLILGNSNEVKIGEKVIAIGNPFGLEFSVSQGIVSGIRQKKNGIQGYIQTDSALNPGNSGGPLLNMQGEVIGINNLKISGGENIGFALESNQVKQSINKIFLEKKGYELLV